jgi:hypothetical protein
MSKSIEAIITPRSIGAEFIECISAVFWLAVLHKKQIMVSRKKITPLTTTGQAY